MHYSFGEMHYLHALSFRKVIKSISKNFKVPYVKTSNCPIDYENDIPPFTFEIRYEKPSRISFEKVLCEGLVTHFAVVEFPWHACCMSFYDNNPNK